MDKVKKITRRLKKTKDNTTEKKIAKNGIEKAMQNLSSNMM